MRDALDREHEQQYGYAYGDDPDHPTEWVNLRVTGLGPIDRPALPRAEPGDGDASRAVTGQREVVFDAERCATTVVARDRLLPGDTIEGPAVVEEFGSTLPLAPGYQAEGDALSGLVVTRA